MREDEVLSIVSCSQTVLYLFAELYADHGVKCQTSSLLQIMKGCGSDEVNEVKIEMSKSLSIGQSKSRFSLSTKTIYTYSKECENNLIASDLNTQCVIQCSEAHPFTLRTKNYNTVLTMQCRDKCVSLCNSCMC